VLALFTGSLSKRGFLCLGTQESLQFSESEPNYAVIDKKMKIYKKLAVAQ
jgi:chemotaxis protein methyltransferase CheR